MTTDVQVLLRSLALHRFQESKRALGTLDEVLIGAVLHAAAVGTRWVEALELLEEASSPPALGSALLALAKASRWPRALELLPKREA